MTRNLWVLIIIVLAGKTEAQNFGGFPPSVKWRQFNTDTARIIFEPNSAEQAQRVATIIHKMALNKPASLGQNLRKINIVLHSNTTLANGYVGLGPFRSEYYLVPSSNIFDQGSLPWSEHLAVHEYRHVQQYNNFNRGLTKGFSLLFGQEGRAFANALTIPGWFFEGDAVHAETSLTPQGRGRQAYFLSGYKSLWQSGKEYSMMKLLNGSLKDYVPDHYQLGYVLVNHGYEKHGTDFWKKVTADASAFKGLIYPFRKGIQKYGGLGYKAFFKEAITANKKGVNLSVRDKQPKETVTNYYFPHSIGEDSVVYLKDSYKKIPAFYIKDSKGEHKIKLRSISSEDWLSYRNGLLAYTAFSSNPRWSLVDYSNIILLDILTKKEKKLTSKGRYFTPDISPSGEWIIAVSINGKLETELHLLNSSDGSKLKTIKSNNRFFVHPRFIDNDHLVVGIRMPGGTISLNKMNLRTEETEALTPPSFSASGYPSSHGDTIYFTAAYNANDDLYAHSLKDNKLFQLTSDQTGNYYANAFGCRIVYSHFSSTGLRITAADKNMLQWTEVSAAMLTKPRDQYGVAHAKENILATPNRFFPAIPYKKSTGLFNFHSWRPSYSDPEFTYSLYGNNILNTLNTELFYRYNQNEKSHGTGANLAYSAWFPILRIGGEYTVNRQVRIRTSPTTIVSGVLHSYELNGGYYIPLNFIDGKMYKRLSFGNTYALNKQLPSGDTKKILRSIQSPYLSHFINWSQQLPKARQNIFPKFGYAINNAYRHRLGRRGYQINSNAQLYLPSIGNHSLVLSGSYQQEDASNIIFSNRFSNSRGYQESDSSRMWRASANYHFPVAYPDWGFGGIVYFQRLRTNLFYDLSQLYSDDKEKKSVLRSTGLELFFDTKWWNQLPVSFGIRYSYLIDAAALGKKHQLEIIIPTDLLSN